MGQKRLDNPLLYKEVKKNSILGVESYEENLCKPTK